MPAVPDEPEKVTPAGPAPLPAWTTRPPTPARAVIRRGGRGRPSRFPRAPGPGQSGSHSLTCHGGFGPAPGEADPRPRQTAIRRAEHTARCSNNKVRSEDDAEPSIGRGWQWLRCRTVYAVPGLSLVISPEPATQRRISTTPASGARMSPTDTPSAFHGTRTEAHVAQRSWDRNNPTFGIQ